MNIAIIGTGGVGGYFGGKIANAGYDTTFFCRGEQLKALQTNGLTVKSINGDENIYRITKEKLLVDLNKINQFRWKEKLDE